MNRYELITNHLRRRLPIAEISRILAVGDTVMTNSSGAFEDMVTTTGVIGELGRSRFFIWQNERRGGVGELAPESIGLTRSWSVDYLSLGWIALMTPGKGKPPKPPLPFRDKSLPARGIDFVMTDPIATWYTNFCATLNVPPLNLESQLKILCSDKHVEAVFASDKLLHIITRPGLVRNSEDLRGCRKAPGWDIQVGSQVMDGENGILAAKARDGRLPNHPNVKESGFICFGDWPEGTEVHRGNLLSTLQVLLIILYGEGKNGYSYWSTFFDARKKPKPHTTITTVTSSGTRYYSSPMTMRRAMFTEGLGVSIDELTT